MNKWYETFWSNYKVLARVMRNPELVLYPLKVHSASHMLEMPKYFIFWDPARKELTGHLRLLVWGAQILKVQSCAMLLVILSIQSFASFRHFNASHKTNFHCLCFSCFWKDCMWDTVQWIMFCCWVTSSFVKQSETEVFTFLSKWLTTLPPCFQI